MTVEGGGRRGMIMERWERGRDSAEVDEGHWGSGLDNGEVQEGMSQWRGGEGL